MCHIIVYAIVPIFVVMLAGYIAGRRGVFDTGSAKAFNKVVLDFALPAALFVSIVGADRDTLVRNAGVLAVSLAGIMSCFMLVYFVYARCFGKRGVTGADAAVMSLTSGSPAIGFLGFAVLEPIFGANAGVALMVAIVGIVVNAVGIPVGLFLLGRGEDGCKAERGGGMWRKSLHALAQPVAWAPLLAVAWVMSGIPWPQWASPSLELIKGANSSLAVFAAGVTLSAVSVRVNLQVVWGIVLKLVVMPGLLLALGILSGMSGCNVAMLVVAGTLPPAFTGIIIAEESGRFVAESTSTLALSMVLFMVFCPLWIWITGLFTGPIAGLTF